MYFMHMKSQINPPEYLYISNIVVRKGIRQADISRDTGISQSQISRVLSGHISPKSKAYKKICIYVIERNNSPSVRKVEKNPDLTQALAEVWDGSANQAKLLATFIRTLGQLIRQYGIH